MSRSGGEFMIMWVFSRLLGRTPSEGATSTPRLCRQCRERVPARTSIPRNRRNRCPPKKSGVATPRWLAAAAS